MARSVFAARHFLSIGAALAIGLGAPTSALAEPSAADRAAAQALFDDGIKLMDAKDYPRACPKLEASNRLDPATGTRFNLAECFARTGKTATAWTLFLDVATATKASGQVAREKLARARAKDLEPKLAKLTITVPHAAETPGLRVERDDSPVADALWGTALPIDQGEHVVSAKAPGRRSWSTTVAVTGDGTSVTTSVPELEPLPEAPPLAPMITPERPPVDRASSSSGSGQRTAGFVVLGFGVAGLAVGAATGIIALSKNHDATRDPKKCPTANTCFSAGLDEVASARSAATVSTIAFAAGGAAVAGGLILVLTARKSTPSSALRITPAFGPGSASLLVSGRID